MMPEQVEDVRAIDVTEERVARVESCRPACPVCGGALVEIRHKRQCSQCHTICETCCEGGRG